MIVRRIALTLVLMIMGAALTTGLIVLVTQLSYVIVPFKPGDPSFELRYHLWFVLLIATVGLAVASWLGAVALTKKGKDQS